MNPPEPPPTLPYGTPDAPRRAAAGGLLERPFTFLERHGAKPWLWWLAPLVLYSWTLAGPFVFDDLHLLLKAERYWAGETDNCDLFRFAPDAQSWKTARSRAVIPWFAHEDTRIDFLRPLASASFLIDVSLFGRNPIGHHAVSLALFALLLPCACAAFRAAGAGPVRAGAATFFLGISQALTQPVGLVANRSDLFVIIGLALAANAWWTAQRARPGLSVWIGPVGFVAALLAKEPAIAFIGAIVLHAFVSRPIAPARKILLIVYLLIAAAYCVVYIQTRGANMARATDAPSPLTAWPDGLWNLPLYLSVWTIGYPIGVLLQSTGWAPILVRAVGALTALALLPALRRQWRSDPASRFFAVWAIAFTAIALLTFPESRALSVATVGWAYLLTGLILRADGRPAILREPPDPIAASAFFADDGARGRWALRHMLLCGNGIVSVACGIATLVITQHAEMAARRTLLNCAAEFTLHDGDALIINRANSPWEMICAGDRLEYLTGRRDIAVTHVAAPGVRSLVSQYDDRSLRLAAPPPGPFGSRMHQLLLGPRFVPTVGRTFVLRDFTATIETVAKPDVITAITLHFNDRLGGDRIHYCVVRDQSRAPSN